MQHKYRGVARPALSTYPSRTNELSPDVKKQSRYSAKLIPKRPIDRFIVPVKSFLHIEAFSGSLLLFCTVFAIFIANSPWASYAVGFWKTKVSIGIGSYSLHGDLVHIIINDALVTVFFFVVGLEIKREIVSGELNDPRKPLLPVFGAIGGVVVPATIYSILQWGRIGTQRVGNSNGNRYRLCRRNSCSIR
jgi:Na+/H+ antiporter 1